MELENIILSEVTQTQKDLHGVSSLISGYQGKKSTKYPIYSPQNSKMSTSLSVKCPSEEASVPLGREKKAITSGEDRKSVV